MVAKLLHLGGLYLGQEEDISGPAPDNLDGFWENTKFVRLNDELMSVAGGGWDCPRPLPPRWEDQQEYAGPRSSAELLLREFADREPWGWKDPRNSITLPFWSSLISGLRVVVCVRNPLEVVRSLQRRNHFSFELALGLWKTYTESLLASSSTQTRIVTHYDAYFADPDAEICRLLSSLDLPDSLDAVERCRPAVLESLRHQRSRVGELSGGGVVAEVRELYRQLCAEAGFTEEPRASVAVAASGGEPPIMLAQAEDVAAMTRRLSHDRSRLDMKVRLSDRIEERDQTIRDLQEELGLKTAQLARTSDDFRERIRERDETIQELQAQLSMRLAEYDRAAFDLQAKLKQRLDERDETIRSLRAELEAKARDEQAHRTLSERVAQYGLAVERTHADLQSKLYAQLQERDDTIRSLQAAAHSAQADVQARIAELEAESRRQLAALYEKLAERDAALARREAEWSGRLTEQQAEGRARLAELYGTIAERDGSLQALHAEAVQRERDMRQQQVTLHERLTAAQELVRSVEAQRDQALQDVRWRNEQLDKMYALQVELAELRQAVALERESTAEQRRAVAAQRDAAAAERAAAAQARHERDELLQSLHRIYGSRLWRAGTLYWRMLQTVGMLPRPAVAPAPPAPLLALPAAPSVVPAPPVAPVALLQVHPVPAVAPAAAVAPAPDPAEVTAGADGRFDVVCFPIIDWGFRFQRPQQLMARFAAAGHRVFYIAQRFRQDGEPYQLQRITERVWEVSLRGPDRNVYTGRLDAADVEAFFASLDALRRDHALGATLSVVQLPFWSPLAGALRERHAWPVVYDCMDDHAGFSNTGQEMLGQEAQLLATADLTVVSSALLYEGAVKRSPNVKLIRNGCDYEHFARVPATAPRGSRPVIGYYGAIADWFDSDLLADLAERRPDWDFLLVGSTASADISRLSRLANVTMVGEKPYQEIPDWLARFDVAVIPFKRIPLTEATNPVKAYEMLAGGKPVVSVPIPEVRPLAPLVRLASTVDEFESEIEAALLDHDAGLVKRRRDFARENTWDHRYQELAPAARKTFPMASIVIVTYNNLELNRLCLESLYRTMDWPNFEVLVVDNASSDGTRDYLESVERHYPNLTVCLNAHNAGFAAANNVGLERAKGDFLVFLNNDTVSCRGWLSALVRHLQRDRSIGILGPSTNAIGNEGMVAAGYDDVERMPAWAAEFMRAHDGEVFEIKMLAFFCVAMRREVYQEIGPLDERFGIGMFEDDDYAVRVRAAGYRVVCARDSFVHHFMKASFKKLSEDDYQRLFERNKKLFEEKWKSSWTPHEYART